MLMLFDKIYIFPLKKKIQFYENCKLKNIKNRKISGLHNKIEMQFIFDFFYFMLTENI